MCGGIQESWCEAFNSYMTGACHFPSHLNLSLVYIPMYFPFHTLGTRVSAILKLAESTSLSPQWQPRWVGYCGPRISRGGEGQRRGKGWQIWKCGGIEPLRATMSHDWRDRHQFFDDDEDFVVDGGERETLESQKTIFILYTSWPT